jgi:integrase
MPGLAKDGKNAALYLVAGLVAATSLGPLTLAVIILAVTGNWVIVLLLASLALNLVVAAAGIIGGLGLLTAAGREGALAPAAEACSIRARTLPRSHSLHSDEMGRLFQVCAQDPTPGGARDGALFAVLFGGCLSISQAAALNLADYDRASGALTLPVRKKRERTIHVVTGHCLASRSIRPLVVTR